MKRNLPKASDLLNQSLPGHPDVVIAELLGTGLNAHVFRAYSSKLKRDFACKVIPRANLIGADQEPPPWREEFLRANAAPSARVVKFMGEGEWTHQNVPLVYWLADYVRGKSLRKTIESGNCDMNFVEAFLGEMLDFLRELQEGQLSHGDFHAGNVLVEDRKNALIGPKFGFRITDFGVAPMTTGATLLDDFEQLAIMTRQLLESIDYTTLSPKDRFFWDWINDRLIGKHLFEHDVVHDSVARNPTALFEVLHNAHSAFITQTAGKTRKTLTTPFDYLSCEQIGASYGLLKELYSDKLLGLQAIEERNNLVLTGPRGCGKTTVFRSLSLDHRYFTDDDEPAALHYLGVYYMCNDLYFNFPRYKCPSKEDALNIPLHFLSVTLIRALLMSLEPWLRRHYAGDWNAGEGDATAALWTFLGLNPPQNSDANRFATLIRALEKERERAAKKQRFVEVHENIGVYFGPEVVPGACAILAKYFPAVAQRQIYFFVDDYSSPKITIDLQRNLNRLLMQRASECFFKVATESPSSYANDDVDGKVYVEEREYRLRNLGIDFIKADSDEKLRFVDDIFGRRFKYATNYPVSTLQDLIGENRSAPSYNEQAMTLRRGERPEIWGRAVLGELCSGDVHFLIELVGKMVDAAGGTIKLVEIDQLPRISSEVQSQVIRSEAGSFLNKLRALPNGPHLVEVVAAFGAVAHSFLQYRGSKNASANPPHQASRIEPYEDPKLDGEAKKVYDDLLRYSVFIEDVRGKSRRGKVVPRLYLRRFLIPHFNLTFSKRDSLEMSVEDFKTMLLEPAKFHDKKRLKVADGGDDGQGKLPF